MEQPEFVEFVLDALDHTGISYAIVGSFASIAYGEPRYTNDIDILIQIDAVQLPKLCQRFPAPDWYVSESAAQEAVTRKSQFNVIHTLSGNKADFMVAGDSEWYLLQFERRIEVRLLPDRMGFAVHPEDIILGKPKFYAEGGSEKHLRDIAGILAVSRDLVDIDHVAEWATRINVHNEWHALLKTIKDNQK